MDDRALSALHAIDPGCCRQEWVTVGMAAKDAGLTLEDFSAWSSMAHNYVGERDCANAWRSFDDGAVKAGTLFAKAFQAGWVDPKGKAHQYNRGAGQSNRGGIRSERQKHTPLREGPEALWGRCLPATDRHPYIVSKLGLPDGLRTVPDDDPLTIAGHAVAGWLVVPASSLSGELRTLQLIPPPGQGKKLNLPAASFGDGVFIVGDKTQSDRVCIAEGIGQAWACWKATGQAAAVCFGAGRMDSVARLLRDAFPDRRLTLVPDRGKESQAEAIAHAIHGDWIAMPTESPPNYDAADYVAEDLAELLSKANSPPLRYRVLTAHDVRTMPPLDWLVRGVVPRNGLACIFGASGAGKSFVALDLCAAVAAGTPWFGRVVTAALVVYAALEGGHGFRQRVAAWETYHSHRLPERLRFVMQPIDLRNPNDVTELADAVIAAGCAGGLLVIDTLNRAASGADENSSADMGSLIDAAKALQARLSGVVQLVHHSGKDSTKGLRGHSSLHAALDAVIEVVRNDNLREWRIAKAKDDDDSASHRFRLNVVDIGTDEDGEPITSCVVVEDDATTESRPKIPKGGNQRIVWDALGELLVKSSEYGKGGASLSGPCVELEVAVACIGPRLTCEPKRKTERARAALTGLITRKLVANREGWLWLP